MLKYYRFIFILLTIFILQNINSLTYCQQEKKFVDGKFVNVDKVHIIEPGNNIQSVIDESKEGDYIILKSGNHKLKQINSKTGEGIIINEKKHLSIIGETNSWIRTDKGWVQILVIKASQNIYIKNIGLIHDVEPGYCYGSVLKLNNVENINIINSIMHGSGTKAVLMSYANGVNIIGGKAIKNTEGVFELNNCKDVVIKDVLISENDNSGYWSMGILDISHSINISFVNNTIKDNKNQYFKLIVDTHNIKIEGNKFLNNSFD